MSLQTPKSLDVLDALRCDYHKKNGSRCPRKAVKLVLPQRGNDPRQLCGFHVNTIRKLYWSAFESGLFVIRDLER